MRPKVKATTPRSAWKRWRAPTAITAIAAVGVALLATNWFGFSHVNEGRDSSPANKKSAVVLSNTQASEPLPGNDSSVSAVNSRLILTGTLVARNPRNSLAFVGVDPKNPQTYTVESLLVNGTRIQSIAIDHVIVERDGRAAKVLIGGAWQEPSHSAGTLMTVNAPALEVAQVASTDHALTDSLAISPEFDSSGMLAGYRLRPGRNSRTFAQWGLEPGDRLVALERAPLVDAETSAQLLELVGRGESIEATILRHGELITVVLDGSAIEEERARAADASKSMTPAPSG